MQGYVGRGMQGYVGRGGACGEGHAERQGVSLGSQTVT